MSYITPARTQQIRFLPREHSLLCSNIKEDIFFFLNDDDNDAVGRSFMNHKLYCVKDRFFRLYAYVSTENAAIRLAKLQKKNEFQATKGFFNPEFVFFVIPKQRTI